MAAVWMAISWIPTDTAAQKDSRCPAPSEYDAGRVKGVLSIPFPDLLAQYGLDSADVNQVVALTDSTDGGVCDELRRAVTQDRADGIPRDARLAFFRSGSLYFVTLSHRRSPTGPVMLDGPRAGLVYAFGGDRRLRVRLRA
jgi:hypothetical protein